ncbi:MAG: AI-2E family transporter [Bacteroidota bacterium]
MHLSFQNVFYVIATIIGFFAILVLAKAVLIPIAFAFLIAFILFPIARKFESWGMKEIMSASLAILAILLIIGGGIFLFSKQIIQLSENLINFKAKILNVFTDATLYINENIEFLPQFEKGELFDKIKTWVNESAGKLVSQTFSSTASTIFGLLSSIVFTFLILIYRKGLVRALVRFYPQEHREKAFNMLKAVQQIGQQYLLGMLVVILILGIVNSIGLLIIGLDNPFLFGFLAALLALIPYAGTFLGAAIPILYSFITYDNIWMPITIAIFFWFVQVVESNFLTPKIVGGNLRINALTSILSIIIGASVWGIAGMVVFLPFAAMLRVICEEYEELKPIALLIGDQNYNKNDVNDKFVSKWFEKIKTWLSQFDSVLKE